MKGASNHKTDMLTSDTKYTFAIVLQVAIAILIACDIW